MRIVNENNKGLQAALYALFFVCIAVTITIFNNSPKEQVQVYAQTDDNMSGYAWSSNIGWISFNCTNTATCAASDYGVHVDDAQKSVGGTGDFSGHAWSSNIGWISFNRADTGNPPGAPFNSGSGPIAQIDWTTGNITGWARALSADGNGWDGWIKLSGIWANGVRLDMSVTPNELRGYAWGSDVVGWVSFNCASAGVCSASNYKVTYGHINIAPIAPDFSVVGAYRGIQRSFSILSYGTGDPEGDPISIVPPPSLPSEGTFVQIGATGIGYTNTGGFDGQDSFDYTVSDGSLTDSGTITVFYGWCGDDIPNGPEQCDGGGPVACSSIGPYTLGMATCNVSCNNWNVLSCLTQCGDSLDNDSDSRIDAADPGCWSNPADSSTYNLNDTSEDNCGNNLCESSTGETRLTCPDDCKARIEEF